MTAFRLKMGLRVCSLLALSMVIFQNCIVEIRATALSTPTPSPSSTPSPTATPKPVGDVVLIEHWVGGGYPGPNGQMFTDLQLRPLANGSVRAELKTESCTNSGEISASAYSTIVANSEPARYISAADGEALTIALCPDCSTTTLNFTFRDGRRTAMVALQAAQLQIRSIVEDLKNGCSPTISELRYFRGGWFGIAPNWKHDFTIYFGRTANGYTPVSGKYPDPFCFRSGSLDEASASSVLGLVNGLQLAVSDGQMGADAGVETVELRYGDGQTKTIHLMRIEAPAKALYALNPEMLSRVLNMVGDNLAVGCAGPFPVD